jgi:hypothetical protein
MWVHSGTCCTFRDKWGHPGAAAAQTRHRALGATRADATRASTRQRRRSRVERSEGAKRALTGTCTCIGQGFRAGCSVPHSAGKPMHDVAEGKLDTPLRLLHETAPLVMRGVAKRPYRAVASSKRSINSTRSSADPGSNRSGGALVKWATMVQGLRARAH